MVNTRKIATHRRSRSAELGEYTSSAGHEFPDCRIGFVEGCWRDRPMTRTQKSEFPTSMRRYGGNDKENPPPFASIS